MLLSIIVVLVLVGVFLAVYAKTKPQSGVAKVLTAVERDIHAVIDETKKAP